MAAKPPVDPTRLPPKEPDPFPEAVAAAADDATVAAFMAEETVTANDGYNVPPSPLAQADRILAHAHARVATLPPEVAAQRRNHLDGMAPMVGTRNYANEVYASDEREGDDRVLDFMTSNVAGMAMVEPPRNDHFREFEGGEKVKVGERVMEDGSVIDIEKTTGQLAYEAFMHEPVVIRIHATRDKNEPPLVYCGINGDGRWLPRNVNIRLPRKHVERLAAAQEMLFESRENKDPNVDNAMQQLRTTAAAYEFSVLHDPNPLGRRWLSRIIKQGS